MSEYKILYGVIKWVTKVCLEDDGFVGNINGNRFVILLMKIKIFKHCKVVDIVGMMPLYLHMAVEPSYQITLTW